MTGVTCEAGNAHSSPNLTLQWRVHVALLFTDLPMSKQVYYWSTIFILVAVVWTDLVVDKYIGMRLQCCCI